MKTPILSLTVVLLGNLACETVPEAKYRPEISGLTDMSFEFIKGKWGEPDYNLPKTSGRTVRFKDILVLEQEPLSETVIKKVCTSELQLDKEGLVRDWSYLDCRGLDKSGKKQVAKPKEPQKEEDFDVGERKLPDLPMAPGE
ncbi:MAG: hypothetical protein HRU19_24070 [Pseudobacteriovorax sp.]|nr:hypothetical protein [Pseudobacteriovorax sp.]